MDGGVLKDQTFLGYSTLVEEAVPSWMNGVYKKLARTGQLVSMGLFP